MRSLMHFSRFFGCGLPFPAKLEGCRVLDLGSGSGRDCFAFSKLVGPSGHVTGIDMTEQLVRCTHLSPSHLLPVLSLQLIRPSFCRSQHPASLSSIIKRSSATRSPMSHLSRDTWKSSVKQGYREIRWTF